MRIKSNAGHIAISSLLLMSFGLLITGSLLSYSLTSLRISERNVKHEQAMCIAEAGADYASTMLKDNSAYGGTDAPVSFGGGSFAISVDTVGGNKIVTSTGTVAGEGGTATIKMAASSGGGNMFPDGCIIARDDANISGSAVTQTSPSTLHQASVYANGDIKGTGSIVIDGYVAAHGTATLKGSYSVYYPPAISGAPEITFPSQSEIDAWQQKLIDEAKAGGTMSGINASGSKSYTITAPVYIDGDVKLTGSSTVTINGTGTVYVNGSIKTTGSSTVKSSALLAAADEVDMTGSGSYEVTAPTTDNVALISFAEDKSAGSPAITFTGSSASIMNGFIYSANGGIKLTGSADFRGAFVAAGGSVKQTGSGRIIYPADLMADSDVVPSGFSIKWWLTE